MKKIESIFFHLLKYTVSRNRINSLQHSPHLSEVIFFPAMMAFDLNVSIKGSNLRLLYGLPSGVELRSSKAHAHILKCLLDVNLISFEVIIKILINLIQYLYVINEIVQFPACESI